MKTFFSKKQKASKKGQGRGGSSSDSQTPSASAKALDIVIETIQVVKDVVPINTAKNILTGISTILVHLRASLKNKGSLKELVCNCEDICSILVLVTKGVDEGRMNEAHKKALDSLESSINDLQSRDALERGRARRFLIATLDEKEIGERTTELNRILISLSAKLNIVAVPSLPQTREWLEQTDVPNLIPDPPPLPPAIFFGRDELLRQLNEALLRDEDVTLIGPGGIGKSTIAMAVMNDEEVVQSYRRRFFVTYNGMDPTKITFGSFMDRIASVLGLPTLGAESERQVKSNLGLSRVLLVLDNAETFEDASDRDEAKRISDFVSLIANAAGVTVLLTSRTSGNARRVSWTQFDVPPLEKGSARLAFRMIYHGEISDDDIDGLLTEVDFHPLSISILAYTARESRWTGKVLLDRWKAQRSKFLQTGDGKDNLAFTIRLSLDSPSVKTFGDDVLRVLRIIAFFPQGINQDHLSRLFPTISNISSVVDTLCKVSLISPSGAFLTTLAPVRLFLLESSPIASAELENVRRMYYDSLEGITREKDSRTDLIVSDHLNIEHLIAFDIAYPTDDILSTAFACSQFLCGLAWNRPRPTLLTPLISSLPEDSSTEKYLKAPCLHALGGLYCELSAYMSAGTFFLAANTLIVTLGNHTAAAICTSHAARSYYYCGYFSHARQLLDDFMRSASWQYVDEEHKSEVYYALDLCNLCMENSSECANKLFLRSVGHPFYGLDSRIRHWKAKMYHGQSTPQEVESALEPLQFDCMSSSDVFNRWFFLVAATEVAFLQRRFNAAIQLLNQAHDAVNANFSLILAVLRHKAAIASVQGDYDLARSLLQSRLDTFGAVASPSIEFLKTLYVQGQNELYAGNHSRAHQLLTDLVAHCDACDGIQTKTWCIRALGELELCLGREMESNTCFAQAVELCREAGAPPELLGICDPMMQLDDDMFPGWKRFLRVRPE